MIRSMMRLVATAGLAVLSLTTALAQTTILDTIGTGTSFGLDPETGIGGNITTGRFIGLDPGTASPVTPKTAATAGYAVQPFSVTSLPGGATTQPLATVQIVLNSKSTTGTTPSNLDQLYGAIYEPNTTGSPSLPLSTRVGNTFRFDTSQVINGINPGEGDNRVRILNAIDANAAGINLETGKTYWLVIMPKNGLNTTDVEALFQWGIWQSRAASQITNPANGGAVTNAFTTATSLLWEHGGARAGSTLTLINGSFFGARIGVGALTATVSGTIAFQTGLANVPLNQQIAVTLTPSGGGTPITQTVTPDASGNFTTQPVPRGNYRLRVKTLYTLSEAADVNLSAGNVTGVNFTLRGGDINSDNAADIGDLLILISAYNKVNGQTGFSPAADINNDNANDISDLLILIANYNQLGEN